MDVISDLDNNIVVELRKGFNSGVEEGLKMVEISV